MGTQKLFFIKNRFSVLSMGSVIVSLSRKMVLFFFSNLFTLFGFIWHCVFRLKGKYIAQKNSSSYVLIQSQENHQTDKSIIEEENNDDLGGENESESLLRFRFPTYEEFTKNNGELVSVEGVHAINDDEVLRENSNDEVFNVPTIGSSVVDLVHHEEIVGSQISSETVGSVRETDVNFVDNSVHVGIGTGEDSPRINDFIGGENSEELRVENEGKQMQLVCNLNSVDQLVHVGNITEEDSPIINDFIGGDLSENSEEVRVENEEKLMELVYNLNSIDQLVHVGIITEEDSPQISSEAEVSQRSGSPINDFIGCDVGDNSDEMEVENKEKRSKFVNNSENNSHFLSDNDESLVSDSDSDSMVSSTKSSFRSSLIDSISDGFLSDIDFERAFEVDTWKEFDELETKSTKEVLTEEDIELQNLSKGYETDDLEDDEEILQELKNLEESNIESVNVALKQEEKKENAEKNNSGEQLSSDSDEQNELEREWEHQDLVEQLKMEIRKVRAIGLPTILEESESPKIAEDLKPWKIEEKFQHEGTLDELHKFYKSYRERMRKLDILNYQKMYAIGFLRMKDPLQSFTRQRIPSQAMATIVTLDCWPCKSKSATNIYQPVMKKFSRELESELEMVYVGQMCLSWEFLRWEYGKALELWDSDPRGIHHYNEVAEKFQQFQVLLTRFVEDDPFQSPRVKHYVKSRCVLRNLLQVPVIREDDLRDKNKARIMLSSKDAITSVKLVEMIEESIRLFWHFIRSDKDTSNAVLLRCRRSSTVELQNPADAIQLAQLRSTLQKKEKKLKELTRSENCILRKFQTHHQEDNSDHVVYFFSQVDLKLVQRVLNMSKITTEQLVWCNDKLSKINFAGRKLLVESSVLLFPCS